MKKIIISLIVLLYFTSVFAQKEVHYGIKAGANMGALIGEVGENDEGSPLLAQNIGIYRVFQFSDKWAFQVEANYSVSGVSFETFVERDNDLQAVEILDSIYYIPVLYQADVKGEIRTKYVDVPIQLILHPKSRFSWMIGARVAYLIKGELTGTADVVLGRNGAVYDAFVEEFDESDSIKKWDYGLTFGSQYRLNDKWGLETDLNVGLGAMNDVNDIMENKYRNLFLSVGLMYQIL